MGHALYSTAPDYMRFLRMYRLNKGHARRRPRVLSEAGLESMLANQIGEHDRFRVLKTAVPAITADCELFPSKRKSHSMAFMRIEEDIPGMRYAGSQGWAGVLNTHFWLDPKANLAGPADDAVASVRGAAFRIDVRSFERAAYRHDARMS